MTSQHKWVSAISNSGIIACRPHQIALGLESSHSAMGAAQLHSLLALPGTCATKLTVLGSLSGKIKRVLKSTDLVLGAHKAASICSPRSSDWKTKLREYGLSGLLAYGLLNTIYYSATFWWMWTQVYKVPRGKPLALYQTLPVVPWKRSCSPSASLGASVGQVSCDVRQLHSMSGLCKHLSVA